MKVRLVNFDRGDGSTSLLTFKEVKAFCALFKGMTPEEIAVKLSTKFLPHTHYFVALRRVPRNRDPRENEPFRDHEYDPDQLQLDFPNSAVA